MLNFYQIKLAIIIISAFILAAHFALNSLHEKSKHNVKTYFRNLTMLVVAHPDDETMFFGPTLLNLVHDNKFILILCLSHGNANKLAEQRQRELESVVKALGPNVMLKLINDTNLPDSMSTSWNVNRVNRYIEQYINEHESPIQTIVTFDSYGVSGHINHRSLYRAVRKFKNNSKDLSLNILTLKSVSLARKYTSYFDSIMTIVQNYLSRNGDKLTITLALDTSGFSNLKRILSLHRSQMNAWFRQMYMIFSRYMFINDLELLDTERRSFRTSYVSN